MYNINYNDAEHIACYKLLLKIVLCNIVYRQEIID